MLRKLVCFLLASSVAALLPPSHTTPRRRSVVNVETELGAAWAMGPYSDLSPGMSAQEPSSSWAVHSPSRRVQYAPPFHTT